MCITVVWHYMVLMFLFTNIKMDLETHQASLFGFSLDFETILHNSMYISLPLIILILANTFVFGSNSVYSIYPCDEGFILKQSTRKFRAIRWNEIESICCTFARTPKSPFTRNRVYKICCHDGYTLTFDGNRKSLAKLDQTIEEQFTRRRLPGYLADYTDGRSLHFGPLTVGLNGISINDTMRSWEQIADVSLLKDRRLVISSAGDQQKPWLTLSAFNVPNLILFLAL